MALNAHISLLTHGSRFPIVAGIGSLFEICLAASRRRNPTFPFLLLRMWADYWTRYIMPWRLGQWKLCQMGLPLRVFITNNLKYVSSSPSAPKHALLTSAWTLISMIQHATWILWRSRVLTHSAAILEHDFLFFWDTARGIRAPLTLNASKWCSAWEKDIVHALWSIGLRH